MGNNASKTLLAISMVAGVAGSIYLQRQRAAKSLNWQSARLRSGAQWALITGASSGIGAAFARRLAWEGYSLVLVARRAERLNELAAEIEKQTGLAAEVLAADLDRPEDMARVEQRLTQTPTIDLLVNNAGFGLGGQFAETDPERLESMVRVHAQASLRLMRTALPGMLARKHGAIINVSSMASFMPMPGSVNYCATKAYLTSLSEGLGMELRGSGVRVQALCPGLTHTEFHGTARENISGLPEILWMSADAVVDASLRGLHEDRVTVIPGWVNQVLYQIETTPLIRSLTRWVVPWARERLSPSN